MPRATRSASPTSCSSPAWQKRRAALYPHLGSAGLPGQGSAIAPLSPRSQGGGTELLLPAQRPPGIAGRAASGRLARALRAGGQHERAERRRHDLPAAAAEPPVDAGGDVAGPAHAGLEQQRGPHAAVAARRCQRARPAGTRRAAALHAAHADRPQALLAEIRQAREDGYAITQDQVLLNQMGVATLLRDERRQPLAAISVTAAADEYPRARLVAEIVPQMLKAAYAICGA